VSTVARTIIITLLAALAWGCVSVEMPENMVSDVVDASKDAYYAIMEKLDDEEEELAMENIYAAAYLGDENTTINDAKQRCREKALAKAKSKLGRDEISTAIESEEIKTVDDEFVVICEIKVLD